MTDRTLYVELAASLGQLPAKMATGAKSVLSVGDATAVTSKGLEGLATVATQSSERVAAGLTTVVTASDRLVAAQTRLAAAEERVQVVRRTSTASLREQAAAQAEYIAAADRANLLARPATPHIQGNGLVGLVAGIAGTELAVKTFDAVKDGVKSRAALDAVNQQIDATLASTGDTAGTTRVSIDKLSDSISRQTGISVQSTRAGELLELTFTGVKNEGDGASAIFDRAAKTAANMAIGLHLAKGGAIDYQSAMQQLGRALNDPVAGMTLLTRAGVSFTAQQKQQIKTLAQSGQTLQAQSLILDLVNQKYGDASKIFGNTAEGEFAKAKEALDAFERSLAGPIITTGLPILKSLTSALEFLSAHPVALGIGEVAVALTGVALAAVALEKAVAFLKESQWLQIIGRWVFGYNTMEGALVRLTAAEEATGGTAEVAAGQESLLAASFGRTGATAAVATPEVEALTLAQGGGIGSAGSIIGAGMAGGLGRGAAAASRLASISRVLGIAGLATGAYFGGSAIGGIGEKNGTQNRIANFAGDTIKGAAIGAGVGSIVPVVGTVAGGALGAGAGALISAFHHSSSTKPTPSVQDFLKQLGLDDKTQQQAATQQELDTIYGGFDVVGGAPNMTVDTSALKKRVTSTQQSAATAADAVARATRNLTAARVAAGSANANAASQIFAAEDKLRKLNSDPRHYDPTAIAAAEAHLAALRSSSGSSAALRLANAEDALAQAKTRAATASGNAKAAEQDLAAKRTTTALSIEDVLKKVTGQQRYQRGVGRDLGTLAIAGVRPDALTALQAFEKQDPGTIHEFATHITAKTADELNKQFRLMRADASAIADALRPGFSQGLVSAAIAGSADARTKLEKLAPNYLAMIYGPAFSVVKPGSAGSFIYGGGVIDTAINQTKTGGLPNGPAQRRFGDGGWVDAPAGMPVDATVHGGEFVLSRDMVAGRKPVPRMAMARSASTPVVVHVHTDAPRHVRNETHLHNPSFQDARALDEFESRQRRSRAVWN